MSDRGRYRLAIVLLALLGAQAGGLAAEPDLRFSGYYKNLLVDSKTWAGESFTLDINRLRLALNGSIAAQVRLDLQYDNEVLLGSFLRTSQFREAKDVPPPQYWRLEANYRERPGLYGLHRLYRASVNVSAGDTDVRLGRQRVAWGTGRFWSPLDVLNPLNPTALEREERMGVDAVLLERKFGPVSRASFVHAPSRSAGGASTALQWHGNAKGLDYSLAGGKFAGTRLVGADLAGQIGDAGLRAELARFQAEQGAGYTRWLAGVDYAFPDSLALTAEVYYNGAGARRPADYDFAGLMSGRIQSVGRRYLGLHASYDLTPLLKWDGDLVVNLADRSRYLYTALTYSVESDLTVRAGVRRFTGAPGTEFQRVPDSYFAQLQRFF